MQLRNWQTECLKRVKTRLKNNQRNFTVVACPGAGKTVLQAYFAKLLLEQDRVDYIINLVPTDSLRTGNARVFSSITGIDLSTDRPGTDDLKDGFVSTYQMISRRSNLDALLSVLTKGEKRFAVIADEVHHGSSHDDSRYGDALAYLVERAEYTLTLSGTLWRSDGQAISGVNYDMGHDGLIAVPDYDYTLDQATQDGVVVPVHFTELNGSVIYQVKDIVTQKIQNKIVADTTEATEHRVEVAYKHLINPEGDFCKELLRQAASELTVKIRKHDTLTPDAIRPAGLVVAASKKHADKIALLLEEITGEEPVVIHGDKPDNKQNIRKFTDGELTNSWMVAVGMVSEGVDIPRIKVLAYLTSSRTELVFHQIVGRSMRTRTRPSGEMLNEYSSVFMPSTPILHRYVSRFIVSRPKTAVKPVKDLLVDEEDLLLKEEVPSLRIFRQDLIASSVIGVKKFLNGIEQGRERVENFLSNIVDQLHEYMTTKREEQKV